MANTVSQLSSIFSPPESPYDPPEGFESDLLSVIVVLREEHEVSQHKWMQNYRRLFSSLNRYAKSTDTDTNIIMDEDDLFAILTRRLITDHKFFQAPGRQRESFKVLTKGKALKETSPHFTSLQTLYAVNRTLLTALKRKRDGWEGDNLQARPQEDLIDKFYDELEGCWNAILHVLPDLKNKPPSMRQHNPDSETTSEDHLLFWPIGQELLAKVVRYLLDDEFPNNEWTSPQEIILALEPLSKISWNLREAPWRYLLLVNDGALVNGSPKWRMRSEDRKAALEISRRLLRWIMSLDPLDKQDTEDLKGAWEESPVSQSGPKRNRFHVEVSFDHTEGFN